MSEIVAQHVIEPGDLFWVLCGHQVVRVKLVGLRVIETDVSFSDLCCKSERGNDRFDGATSSP